METIEILDLRLAPPDAKKGPVAYARIRLGPIECSDLPVWEDPKLKYRLGAKRDSWKQKDGTTGHRDVVRLSLAATFALAPELVKLMGSARAGYVPTGESVLPGAPEGGSGVPF